LKCQKKLYVKIPLDSAALQECKSVVIYEVIDVEELEFIKRGMHRNRAIDETGILGRRHKVNGSKDAIEMNHFNVRLPSIGIDIWLHQPEACVFMGFQAQKRKPLDKSTGVLFALMPKGEEEKNAGYFKPTHSLDTGISTDENSVIACRALSP
jgi:hypothetical protein